MSISGAWNPSSEEKRVFPGPIALIGMRGAGKTTTGKLVAQRLGRVFLDLDQETLQRARQSGQRASTTAELLRVAGQAAFRGFEAHALRRLLEPGLGIVLATGGGVVERADSRAWLARTARVVWLDVPLDLLETRVLADGVATRPSLTGADPVQELGLLLQRRAALYGSLANHRIAVGELGPNCDANSVAQAVIAALEPSSK